jgi:hypothetical protein
MKEQPQQNLGHVSACDVEASKSHRPAAPYRGAHTSKSAEKEKPNHHQPGEDQVHPTASRRLSYHPKIHANRPRFASKVLSGPVLGKPVPTSSLAFSALFSRALRRPRSQLKRFSTPEESSAAPHQLQIKSRHHSLPKNQKNHTPHPKPGEGQVHPTASRRLSYHPKVHANRPRFTSKVLSRSVSGSQVPISPVALFRTYQLCPKKAEQ